MIKKGKYYFFGGGANCYSTLAFWGSENIKAIVDSDITKIGQKIHNVPIIDVEELRRCWNGEWVIVTAYVKAKEITKLLKQIGITKYCISKPMMSGFMTVEQMIKEWDLLGYKEICFRGDEVIRQRIYEVIGKEAPSIRLVKPEEAVSNDETTVIISMEREDVRVNGIKSKIIYFEEAMERYFQNKYWAVRKYKGIHQNQKCLLIGNGPSLRISDLEMIKNRNIVTFGCNRINLLYEQTEWRPDYYVAIDPYIMDENREKMEQFDMPCFVQDVFGMSPFRNEHIILFRKIVEDYLPGYPSFSSDMSKCTYGGGATVMYNMLQIAVYMGFKEIYLLGVDFSYGEDGENTHFYIMEQDDIRTKGEGVLAKDLTRRCYISAKNYCESNNIKIYNATRGGNLDIFERKSFDELIKELPIKDK